MAVDTYPWGQCTYYVASRFPAIYGYMGNAKQWVASAMQQGYPVSSTPLPDSIAVYKSGGSYSSDGHVAVVDSVNGDGTFNVSEMNFSAFGQVDQRRSTMDNVIGFVIPPGSSRSADSLGFTQFIKGSANSPAPNTGTPGVCLSQWNFPFGSICLDGVVGGAAMAAGGVLMLGGVTMLIALAWHSTGVGRSTTKLVAKGTPFGAVVAAHQAREQKRQAASKEAASTEQQTAAQSHVEAMRRAHLRTARARARGAEAQAKNTQLRKVA